MSSDPIPNESFETARPAQPRQPTIQKSRTQPHSIEAEEFVLSSILLDGAETLSRAFASGISVASFYDPKHGQVFESCERLLAAGKPIDVSTVAEDLKARRLLDAMGGYGFLSQVSSRAPTTAQAGFFIEVVREQQQLRDLIGRANGLVEQCYNYSSGGVAVHVGSHLAKLLAITAGGRDNVRKWPKVVSDVEGRAMALIAKKADVQGGTISFGWQSLDTAFKPMRRGELAVIAARPSIGKSSLMRPIVGKAALAGLSVLVESLEVSPDDIAIQMASSMAKVSWGRLPHAHHIDQKQFLDALRSLSLPNLHVFDCDRTVAAIVGRAKAIHATKPLDVLAIDYLGLINDCEPRRGETKAQAVGSVTKALKKLAMDLNCVVILLAQLNRSPMQQGNREPMLSDLRDSGDIEQDADRVIFIHRPDEDKLNGGPQKDTDSIADRPRFYQELIQAKGRSVGTGLRSFYFNRETTIFEPAAKETA